MLLNVSFFTAKSTGYAFRGYEKNAGREGGGRVKGRQRKRKIKGPLQKPLAPPWPPQLWHPGAATAHQKKLNEDRHKLSAGKCR